jgi:hypothetical protein
MIDLLVPSFGRPERFLKMARSAREQASVPASVKIHLFLEPDDSRLREYLDTRAFDKVYVPSSHWGAAAPARNFLAGASEGSIVHMTADDLVFHTKGWDNVVRDAMFGYPWRVLHYRDDYKNEEMALNPFVSRTWVEKLGYIHPGFQHFYSDTWFEDIARRAGVLHYRPDLHIAQEHPKLGTAEWDATYTKNRKPERMQNDRRVWEETSEERQRLSEYIRGQLTEG